MNPGRAALKFRRGLYNGISGINLEPGVKLELIFK